jgi:hypothetical protein
MKAALLAWRRRHLRVWYGLCLLVGASTGYAFSQLPVRISLSIALPGAAVCMFMAARELRTARRFRAVLVRLQTAIEEEDFDKIEASYLELAVLLPTAKKRHRQGIGWSDKP